MKKSIFARIMTALTGLLLLAIAGCVTAEAFCGTDMLGMLKQLLLSRAPVAVLVTLAIIAVLMVMALACWYMLIPRRPTRKRGFVMQKTENGPIGISVKAIEGLVRSCVQQQEAIDKADIAIAECRDGINILLNIDQAAGVNIPLSVGVLQKQIKQYVTACTGVDVHEVRVLVENNAPALHASPFAVQEASPVPVAEPKVESSALPETEEATMEAAEAIPPLPEPAEEAEIEVQSAPEAAAAPATQAMPAAVPPMMTAIPAVHEEPDERPLHQRLFGTEEQPAIVPAPPELVIEREEELVQVVEAVDVAKTEAEEIAEAVEAVAVEPVEAMDVTETETAEVADSANGADSSEQEA